MQFRIEKQADSQVVHFVWKACSQNLDLEVQKTALYQPERLLYYPGGCCLIFFPTIKTTPTKMAAPANMESQLLNPQPPGI